jgi:hypothetical protein
MGVLDETQFVERPQFFNGERLFAPDLQSVEAFNREMRWLHNRSLHQPGIGSGFAVAGEKDDRVVTVEPGYALDRDGREIVLTRELQLAIPPVAGEEDGEPSHFNLTVSYANELEETETRAGVCSPSGVVRRREEPVFCWVPLHCEKNSHDKRTEKRCLADEANRKAMLAGEKIVLAQVVVKECSLYERVTLNHRRSARSCRQPHVSGGRTDLSEFNKINLEDFLKLLSESVMQSPTTAKTIEGMSPQNGKNPFLFLQGTIETVSGQFLTVPSYMVNLQRKSSKKGKETDSSVIAFWAKEETEKAIEVILAIYDDDLGGRTSPKEQAKDIEEDIKKAWLISWVGVEG